MIEVSNLSKEFRITKKGKGLRGAVASIFRPRKISLKAVDGVNFKIKQGEIVGYLGPNGAGKSTTVKMMTGILHPTGGQVQINGLSPHTNRVEVVKNIGVVFGQRTQLYWDLRLEESFELLKRIYQIDNKVYKRNLALMNDVLDIGSILNTPVRQLSLGQRMRGDLAGAMLHEPTVLFLDEPTIGLDVEGKYAIRNFISRINKVNNTSVVLTTHDLDDVEQLCNRLIVINHGKIIEDGQLNDIVDKMAPYRYLVVEPDKISHTIEHPKATVVKDEGYRIWLKFNRNDITAAKLIADLSEELVIKDVSVKEPDIEDIVREVYKTSANV